MVAYGESDGVWIFRFPVQGQADMSLASLGSVEDNSHHQLRKELMDCLAKMAEKYAKTAEKDAAATKAIQERDSAIAAAAVSRTAMLRCQALTFEEVSATDRMR